MAPTPDSVDILAGLPESEKSETVFDHSVFSDDKLSTRIFKLDTIALTFRAYWGKRTSSNSVPAAIRNLARKTGVNWDSPPGKMMFFNEGTGLLFVKAPRSDLDTVEDEIKKIVGPQLHIKARFIEAPIETAKALEPSLKMNYASKKTLYGILTSQEYKAILRSLDVKPGVETLAEPEVTTISGRHPLPMFSSPITFKAKEPIAS